MRPLRPPFALSWLTLLALLVLALGHATLATLAMREKSTTADELAHITGGYTFNHWRDFRLHPENGILPQRWQALPATWKGTNYPALDTLAWHKSDVWLVGYDYFYQSGNDPAWLLFTARAMNSLFGAATVLVVFLWSRGLWGTAGSLVSAGFAAVCPTMLAHSGLATSDMCMSFFLLLAVGAFWWHLHDGRKRIWLLSLAVFGLAGVAKYTSVLLLPMALVMVLVRLGQAAPLQLGGHTFATFPRRAGAMVVSLLLHGLAVVAFIWLFFGFRYSAFNPTLPAGEVNLPWALMLSYGGIKAWVIELARSWHLLPEGYLYGLAFVLKHAEARGAFLDGDYSIYGWVEFFPKTFLYKTPLSLLGGLAAGATLLALRLRQESRARLLGHLCRVMPLLTLFFIYWLFSVTSHLNIGHRHILPTYPVLYIFCGVLGWAAERAYQHSRASGLALAAGVAGLLGWQATVAAQSYPHYLAYFNPVAGGPAEGYKHLVDSSLDWGQDLPELKKWLAANERPGEAVYLSYFGTDEPARYVPAAVLMPRLPSFERTRPWYWCEPGLYALSATMLQHVYAQQRGAWTQENERQYQEMRLNDAHFRALKAGPRDRPELLLGFPPEQWAAAWSRYEILRFARLCHYLRARRPDAQPGYSILVFRLDRAELDAALNGDLRTLAAAIEHAPMRR